MFWEADNDLHITPIPRLPWSPVVRHGYPMHYGRRMRKADPSLLERMDVRAALETEISSAQRDLLPVQVGDLAAENHLDEVAQIIDTRAKEGNVGTEAAPVLAASKWRHGRRPVAAIPLPERVLIDQLLDSLTQDSPKSEEKATSRRSLARQSKMATTS